MKKIKRTGKILLILSSIFLGATSIAALVTSDKNNNNLTIQKVHKQHYDAQERIDNASPFNTYLYNSNWTNSLAFAKTQFYDKYHGLENYKDIAIYSQGKPVEGRIVYSSNKLTLDYYDMQQNPLEWIKTMDLIIEKIEKNESIDENIKLIHFARDLEKEKFRWIQRSYQNLKHLYNNVQIVFLFNKTLNNDNIVVETNVLFYVDDKKETEDSPLFKVIRESVKRYKKDVRAITENDIEKMVDDINEYLELNSFKLKDVDYGQIIIEINNKSLDGKIDFEQPFYLGAIPETLSVDSNNVPFSVKMNNIYREEMGMPIVKFNKEKISIKNRQQFNEFYELQYKQSDKLTKVSYAYNVSKYLYTNLNKPIKLDKEGYEHHSITPFMGNDNNPMLYNTSYPITYDKTTGTYKIRDTHMQNENDYHMLKDAVDNRVKEIKYKDANFTTNLRRVKPNKRFADLNFGHISRFEKIVPGTNNRYTDSYTHLDLLKMKYTEEQIQEFFNKYNSIGLFMTPFVDYAGSEHGYDSDTFVRGVYFNLELIEKVPREKMKDLKSKLNSLISEEKNKSSIIEIDDFYNTKRVSDLRSENGISHTTLYFLNKLMDNKIAEFKTKQSNFEYYYDLNLDANKAMIFAKFNINGFEFNERVKEYTIKFNDKSNVEKKLQKDKNDFLNQFGESSDYKKISEKLSKNIEYKEKLIQKNNILTKINIKLNVEKDTYELTNLLSKSEYIFVKENALIIDNKINLGNYVISKSGKLIVDLSDYKNVEIKMNNSLFENWISGIDINDTEKNVFSISMLDKNNKQINAVFSIELNYDAKADDFEKQEININIYNAKNFDEFIKLYDKKIEELISSGLLKSTKDKYKLNDSEKDKITRILSNESNDKSIYKLVDNEKISLNLQKADIVNVDKNKLDSIDHKTETNNNILIWSMIIVSSILLVAGGIGLFFLLKKKKRRSKR